MDAKKENQLVLKPTLFQRLQFEKVVAVKEGPAIVFLNGTVYKVSPGSAIVIRRHKPWMCN
jgi:hypothetical protein